MFGRILCLLGLHAKVLTRADPGPAARGVYYCGCARPTCKRSKPDADVAQASPQGAAVQAITRNRVQV